MAGEAYPGAIADLDGDSEAVHRQLVSVARFHQQRTCEFAAVGFPRLWRLVLPVRRQSARTRRILQPRRPSGGGKGSPRDLWGRPDGRHRWRRNGGRGANAAGRQQKRATALLGIR